MMTDPLIVVTLGVISDHIRVSFSYIRASYIFHYFMLI